MLRILFFIFFLCGLTVVSVFLEDRASAATSQCSPRGVCVPDVPPVCEPLDCDVSRPQSVRLKMINFQPSRGCLQ